MKKSRCNVTAMQPSTHSIEHIPQPLEYLNHQQSTAMESTTLNDNVQCDALRQPWSPAQTHVIPNVMAPLTLQSMSMQHQLLQSAYTSSNSQPNPSPQTSTSILDLNEDCLIEIGQKLDEYDLYRLRESHKRFASATEYCYIKMDSEKSLEFNFRCWSEKPGIGDLVKIL